MFVMRYYTVALAAAGCAASAAANAACTFEDITPSKELKWCQCGANKFCSKLEVPLDYKNQRLGCAVMPLTKVAAARNSSDGPYQGMIVLVPGGPGGSGIDLLNNNTQLVTELIGTNWDIVSYDPRGMFRAEPVLQCSVNPSSSANFSRRDTVPRITDSYYNSFIQYGMEFGDLCAQRSGGSLDAGPHMTTAINARDLITLTDAYARTADGHRAARNSSLLNLYGISYGTVVVQTAVSMFPGRVGNAVLDGVINRESYLTGGWIDNVINHMDGAFALFFIYCTASGPELCPYATGSSAQDTFARFKASLEQLNARKAAAEKWSNATVIADALLTLKNTIFTGVYEPILSYGQFAQVFVDLEAALKSGMLEQWTQKVIAATSDPGPTSVPGFEVVVGVMASDENNFWYGKTVEDLQPFIRSLEEQSIVGEIWMRDELASIGWKVKSNDVFTGPFGGDTATPMLFVSNTYDPVAAIDNSYSAAPSYKNAQILVIDAAGHTSAYVNNTCGFAKIRAYFQGNHLPGHDNFCAAESPPFGVSLNGTLKENIQKANLTDLHF